MDTIENALALMSSHNILDEKSALSVAMISVNCIAPDKAFNICI